MDWIDPWDSERISSLTNSSPHTDYRTFRPRLLYLDLNKWIELAGGAGNRGSGQDRANLKAAEALASSGRAIFPLGAAHFFEVAKIGSDSRRRRIAKLMAELSQGWFLVAPSNLLMAELREAVAAQFKRSFCPVEITPVSRNFKAVWGAADQLDGDFDEEAFSSPEVLEEFLATARSTREILDRLKVFAEGHEKSRSLVWDGAKESRKRAYCTRVNIGIADRFTSVLGEFGLVGKDLEALGPQGCVELLERVPFLDVEINLHVERNEHRDRKIAPNDELDISFLSMAVPYCDVVVSERFWTSLIRRMGLDVKYATRVGHDLKQALSDEETSMTGDPVAE